MTRRLYLVRHGEYTRTATQGEADGPLTPDGRAQLERTAELLARLRITAIVHSGMQRAEESARIIAARLPGTPLRADPDLAECLPCLPEGWEQHFRDTPPAKFEEGGKQAERAWDRYCAAPAEGDACEALVSHGNLIRYFVCRSLRVPASLWANVDVHQGSVTEIAVGFGDRPGWSVQLETFNSTYHLPLDLRRQ